MRPKALLASVLFLLCAFLPLTPVHAQPQQDCLKDTTLPNSTLILSQKAVKNLRDGDVVQVHARNQSLCVAEATISGQPGALSLTLPGLDKTGGDAAARPGLQSGEPFDIKVVAGQKDLQASYRLQREKAAVYQPDAIWIVEHLDLAPGERPRLPDNRDDKKPDEKEGDEKEEDSEEGLTNSLRVYPKRAEGRVTIEAQVETARNVKLVLFDEHKRRLGLLYKGRVEGTLKRTLSHRLPPGGYIVRMKAGRFREAVRFEKVR